MKKASGPSPLMILIVLIALGLFPPAPPLGADDFGYHEPGARAASLGGAFTARADDVSTLFYNPAGLAFLGSFRFKTNITLGSRDTKAAWPDGGQAYRTNPYEILAGHAVSWQPVRRVTVGAGLFPVATYSSVWNRAWGGRTAAIRSELYTGSFRAAVAAEVVKDLAVSAGLDVMTTNVIWHYSIPFNFVISPLPEPCEVESRNALDGRGVGLVAGALWKIVPAVQIGASYRQAVGIDLEGRSTFSYPTLNNQIVAGPGGTFTYVADLAERFYRNQDETGRLTVPRDISCGIALTPFTWLWLYADIQWTRWSEFGAWAFRSVNEDGDLAPGWTLEYEEFYGISPDYGTQAVAFALADTRNIKAALEYRPAKHVAIRVGYARCQSAVTAVDRSPVYPDLDRNIYTLGFGYEGPVFSIWRNSERIADLSFDAFARLASATPQASAYPGFEMTYSSKRFTWGVGVGFSF
jgi:long-chain fatty acid transport protein